MKKNSVKKALIVSVMSLLITFAAFVGTTFAWFTDSVKVEGNKITAGTLDLEMSVYNVDTQQFESVDNLNGPMFSKDNWVPGSNDVVSATMKIENKGSIDFEVSLDFISVGNSKLAEVIEVYKTWGNPTTVRGAAPQTKAELDEALMNGEYAGPVTLEYALTATQYRGRVQEGETIYLGVAMYLPGIVGNEYQGLDAEFDVVVRARQLNGEFEDLPNEGFRTPVSAVFMPANYENETEVGFTVENTTVTIPTSAVLDPTQPILVDIAPAVATEGATSVLKVEAEDVQVYDINVENINPNASESVKFELFVGKNLDVSKMAFYHREELIPFTYNERTGILTFSSNTFSPFTLLISDTIAVMGYENLQFAIDRGYTDITVVGDVEDASSIIIDNGEEVTITLAEGVTVSGDGCDAVFWVTDGTLNLNGDGTIIANYCPEHLYATAVWALGENASVVINGNDFINTGIESEDHYDLIYAKDGAKIDIYGGNFQNVTPKWTLNLKDNTNSDITVYGGKFFQYDPTNSDSENPRANFVADGFVSVLDAAGYYNVVQMPENATQSQINRLAKTLADANEGDVIYLDELNYGTITLGSGSYPYNYPANLTIVGNNTFFNQFTVTDEVIAGWTFQNVNFIGGGLSFTTKATVTNLTLEGCNFVAGAKFSMVNTTSPIVRSENVTINYCAFDSAEGTAILIQAVNNATVQNCTFLNVGFNAVQITKAAGEINVIGNVINGTGDRAIRIANTGADVNVIANNIISNGDANAELFKSSGTNGTITFEYNVWNGQTDAEVVVDEANDYIIKNA